MSFDVRAPAEAPEEVVRRVFVALNAGKWQSVAECAEEGSLERFRRFELALLRAIVGRMPAASDLASNRPDGAAETLLGWFMDQGSARFALQREEWPAGLLGVEDVDDLESVPAADLFVRWLSATYEGAVPWQVQPLRLPLRQLNRRVIGSVREVRVGELLAHVLYRHADDPAVGSRVALTTVRSTPAGWRIDATDTALLLPADNLR